MPLDPHLLGAIAQILAPGQILTAQEDILPYGFDGTAAIKQSPGAVVFPKTTQEVAACMRLASEGGGPVVTRGSGTGLSGGSVPVPNCLVMCLVDMNAILDVDARNLTLRAQSGVITQRIDEAAAPHGLFYPPDPGSLRISTIGGNVAENSGGLRGLKYGVTRDYVMGLEAVLADGTVARFGNACVKDVAGYSLKDLFIGSEGTLGIITEVLLKLLPRPEARKTLLAAYDRMEDAAETVSAIVENHSMHLGVFGPRDHRVRGGLCQNRSSNGLRSSIADGNRRAPGFSGAGSGENAATGCKTWCALRARRAG